MDGWIKCDSFPGWRSPSSNALSSERRLGQAALGLLTQGAVGVTPSCTGFQESSPSCQERSDKANPPRSASLLNPHTWKWFERPGLETESNSLDMTDCNCIVRAVSSETYTCSMFPYSQMTRRTKKAFCLTTTNTFLWIVMPEQSSATIDWLKYTQHFYLTWSFKLKAPEILTQ